MEAYPALGSVAVAEGTAGEESILDQATAGLTQLTEEDHAELRPGHRGVPGEVRLPVDRVRAGLAGPGEHPRAGPGPAGELAPPRNTPPR